MRVGMVGLAALYWPMALARGLQGREGVEFCAAATLGVDDADIRAALGLSAAEYAEKFAVKLYREAENMVADEHLDAVVIITRHTDHAQWAERMAALGVDIFIPKTFTTTLADAERIVLAQKRTGVKIAVGPSARYLPPMMAIKAALDRDLIGRPFALRICHHHGTIDAFGPRDWYRDPIEGGPELSLGWYGIDLALHFMGEGVASVYAQYGNYTSPESPFMDCGRIVMRTKSNGQASFDMYFCSRMAYPSWQVEVVGPKGIISLHRTEVDPLRTVVALDSAAGYQRLPIPEHTPGWETFWIEDFLAGREPALSAREAKEITAIALAAREAGGKGCAISM